jgi:putative transposase
MFFNRGAHHGGLAERKAMSDRTHPLPVRRQYQLLKLARSTAYYHPTPVSEIALARMRRIDERHLQYPFACTRMLRDLLRQEGGAIGRRRVATLIRRMGIEALRRSRLSAADSQAIGSILSLA